MNLDKNEIHVPFSDVKRGHDFMLKTWRKHKRNGRSDKRIQQDIFIGKLGEFAFKKLYKDRTSEVYLEDGNGDDGGFDFFFHEYPEYKIDVKTLRKVHYSKVAVKPDDYRCSHYALMKVIRGLEDNSYIVKFYGFCERKEAIDRSHRSTDPSHSDYYYTPGEYFKLND